MTMNEKMQRTVHEDFRVKREAAISDAEDRQRFLQERIAGLKELDAELASIGPKFMFAAMGNREEFEKLELEFRTHQTSLMKEREALLRAHGFEPDYDSPKFECEKCSDTGYVDFKACECLKNAIVKKNYLNSGLGKASYNQSFENFVLDYYGGTMKDGKSNKEFMGDVLSFCKQYAENFGKESESLFLSGGTGLGKTHLSSAIAKKVIEKGYSVIYDSAQNIFDAFENERFGRSEVGSSEKYKNCSLLIIDDLGAEFVTQFSVAVLYNLLNYRLLNGKPMIISSNLGPKEIEKTYKERIYSRLGGDFTVLRFVGNDIRKIKM